MATIYLYEQIKEILNLSEKDLKELYLNKLSLLVETKEECNSIYSVYVLYIEAIIFDKKILFSPEANKLIRKAGLLRPF